MISPNNKWKLKLRTGKVTSLRLNVSLRIFLGLNPTLLHSNPVPFHFPTLYFCQENPHQERQQKIFLNVKRWHVIWESKQKVKGGKFLFSFSSRNKKEANRRNFVLISLFKSFIYNLKKWLGNFFKAEINPNSALVSFFFKSNGPVLDMINVMSTNVNFCFKWYSSFSSWLHFPTLILLIISIFVILFKSLFLEGERN